MTTITGAVTGGIGVTAYGVNNTIDAPIDIDGVLACGATGVVPVSGAMRLVRRSTDAMTFLDTTDAPLTLAIMDYAAIAAAVLEADIDGAIETAAAKHSLATAILNSVSKVVDNGAGGLEIYLSNGSTLKLTRAITTDATKLPISGLGVGA